MSFYVKNITLRVSHFSTAYLYIILYFSTRIHNTAIINRLNLRQIVKYINYFRALFLTV